MREVEKHKLVHAAIGRFEAAETRLDELSPVAHTFTSGVPAEPEPDDAARRAERSTAKAARDEAWHDLKELLQELYAKDP